MEKQAKDVAVHVHLYPASGRISSVSTGPCRCDINSDTFGCYHPEDGESLGQCLERWQNFAEGEMIA